METLDNESWTVDKAKYQAKISTHNSVNSLEKSVFRQMGWSNVITDTVGGIL